MRLRSAAPRVAPPRSVAPTSAATRVARLLALALVAPGLVACASVPPAIAAEQRKTPPGEATIVEFVDFECPFCRRQHDALAAVVARHPGRVRVVRKQVPLAKKHPHAMDAARASVCADAFGRGDEVADALFRMPVNDLVPQEIERVASQLGVDAAALRACMADPHTPRQISEDGAIFDALGGDGVPLVFVGDERFDGLQDAATLEAAVVRAASR